MDVDNSAAQTFWTCPAKYQERYINDIEPKDKSVPLIYGTRIHQLLENHFAPGHGENIPLEDQTLELEAQVMFEGYKAAYSTETFDIVDVEKFIRVPLIYCQCKSLMLPACSATTRYTFINCGGTGILHHYTAKLDIVGRYHDSGRLFIQDHKTEERGGRNNTPVAWQHKSQVGLYQWAAEQIYGEPILNICIDVLRRMSPAGRIGPEFRRFTTQRTSEQVADAVRDIKYVAENISRLKSSTGLWPMNRDQCIYCPYKSIHSEEGRDEMILQTKFKRADEYRYGHGGNVNALKVIQ